MSIYTPRKRRKGIDLVCDDVELELFKERELILGVQNQLEELLDTVLLQIRKLRPFIINLAEDLRHKKNTLEIEEHNEKLHETSFDDLSAMLKNVFEPS